MSESNSNDSNQNPWKNLPPPWVEGGFESEEAWWDAMVREEQRWRPGIRRKRAKAARLHRGDAPQRRERPGVRSRQVNVRLTPEDHEALEEAAREYGVATAAMAQLLVNRGLEAVARERSRKDEE